MAAVSATFVTCRATGAGAKAARASNGAAVRAPVAMTSKTNGVSLGARQGSRVSARAAAPARSARRVALAAVATDTKEAAPTAEVEEPGLDSEAGVDYTALRDRLKAGEWEEADNEHRRLMIELAGEDAEDRGWVYFTEVKTFPVTDLKTIDTLWSFYSDGKFGFSVQRKIWVGKRRQWAKFFKEIDWVQGENNAYRKWPEEFIWEKEAKRGHMPLTNALRGTQLLEALLEHPAFAPPAKPKTAADQAADAVNQMGDNLKKVMGGGMPGLKGLKKPSWMK